ncbi:MAG: protein-L-isoaspartate(D-aspartate) O-methyltransferase [Pseudomonadota bacterium]
MSQPSESDFEQLRDLMIELITAYASLSGERTGRGELDPRVLAAMARVPRHVYVPDEVRDYAYADGPLPIGYGKTISQPFIVALMTDLLEVEADLRVLEIGTGLGYQAAVLCELAGQVYSVEIIAELAEGARQRLTAAGYENLELRLADGGQGWPEEAPFDRIIVTAAPELVPAPLLQQLKPGGRLVIPAGLEDAQELMVIEKGLDGRTTTEEILPVVFSRLITRH